jgi:RNA methyltransferase, TrmH family
MKLSAERGLRTIESRQNIRVKELRAGLQRGVRTQRGLIAIEGEHLLREAQRSGLRVRTIFVTRGQEKLLDADLAGGLLAGDTELLLLSSNLFRSASVTEHPQGIAALIEPPRFTLDAAFPDTPLLILAAGLQDPGNLGTLVRSAEAFGATGMILLPGTVSLWNAKTLRASSGSAFRLPIFAMGAEEAVEILNARGVRLLAAVPREGAAQADLSGPVAILIGNEGAGLPQGWLEQVHGTITIPCPGPVESLNAAIAGSVLLYEASRQREALRQRRSPRQRVSTN